MDGCGQVGRWIWLSKCACKKVAVGNQVWVGGWFVSMGWVGGYGMETDGWRWVHYVSGGVDG